MNGGKAYQVSSYNGKDKQGHTTYKNFDVTDWEGKIKDAFQQGDFIRIHGIFNLGSYTSKTGEVKPTMRITPISIEKTVPPWEKANGVDDQQTVLPAEAV